VGTIRAHPICRHALLPRFAMPFPLLLALAVSPIELASSGSLLVFPWFESAGARQSVLTVTNTNSNFAPGQGGSGFAGSVLVDFVYREEQTCEVFDRTRILTPNDTFTTIIGVDNPQHASGFVCLIARNPVTFAAIDFDHLVGEMTILDGATGGAWTVPPFVFRARTCPGEITDLNGNGVTDLDGFEYEAAPERLNFPRFEGQSVGRVSELILLNTETLRLGNGLSTVFQILIYNDNEEQFSSSAQFRCLLRISLEALSGMYSDIFLGSTNENPGEPGGGGVENGWFRVRGQTAFTSTEALDRIPIVGILLARTPIPYSSTPYISGDEE